LAKIEKNWKFKREFETNSQSWKLIEGLTKEKKFKIRSWLGQNCTVLETQKEFVISD
jgi:hypothetical protein